MLATTATAEPLYPQPDPDPFYAAPADLGAHQPGDVLDVRAMPPVPLFPGATVTLVKFRSTDSHGGPIAATTTILTPSAISPTGRCCRISISSTRWAPAARYRTCCTAVM